MNDHDQKALEYHQWPKPGKIAVEPTKPCVTQSDLALAYTPGVAAPCLAIQEDPVKSYQYTSRGNLVAVVSNGSAVLGLGNIGPLAGKPVMEGKGVLFKRFAGIDVFDLEVDADDPDELINLVRRLAPTFGGINLEDIKAPECFYIEQKLQEAMEIPVFHDDQHGTAIISGAALINACILTERKLEDLTMVISGAGAAGVACARFYISLGVRPENIVMTDSKGVIYKGRQEGMNPIKEEFAVETDKRTVADALRGVDCFAGLSQPGVIDAEMVQTMAERPLVFAMANPVPEIMPDEVRAVRPDAIIATGRSDFPNQVNNVLGFPFIFRGALDVRARKINEEMKLAACQALARLAREEVPDDVLRAYGLKKLKFGPEYIIPKPFDPRVLVEESAAVAEAAMQTGVARVPLDDLDAYRGRLASSRSRSQEFMREIRLRARGSGKRIIFSDGEHPTIIRAVHILQHEDIAIPVLVGRPELVREQASEIGVDLGKIEIVDPGTYPEREALARLFYDRRKRQGSTWDDAVYLSQTPDSFAALMLEKGLVDGMVCGIGRGHPHVLRSLMRIIPKRADVHHIFGMYIMLAKTDVLFLGDCTVTIEPTPEDLAGTALQMAKVAQYFGVEPRVGMLSFSNFGSVRHPEVQRVRDAVNLVKRGEPRLCVEGEIQIDTALDPAQQEEHFPFCDLQGAANVLVFPSLAAGLLSTKMVNQLGGVEMIGPLTLGFSKPANVLHLSSNVDHVVNVTAITVIECLDGTL